MNIQYQLTTFRENFPLTKVNVEKDYMSYKVKRGWADKVAAEANDLINKLGLDLSAIPTTLSAKDSICIKSSEVEL